MIARFDGASSGAGFSTSRLTLWRRPWFQATLDLLAGDHAVAMDVLLGHLHHRHDRAVGLVVGVDQLADAGPVADDHVVAEDHGERLVADDLLRDEDGVAQAELLLLADVGDLGEIRDVPDLAEHLDVALLLEEMLQLVGGVEVILDRPLLARGDDDHLLDAGGDGLLDGVLDDGLVDERQHLLGLGLRGREEPGPQPAAGKTAFRTRIEPRVRAGWNGRPRIPSAPLRAVEGGSPPVPAGRSGVRGWLFLRACDGAGEPPDHPREGLRPVEVRHVRGAADDDAARVRGNVRERPLRRPEEDVVLAVDQEARSRVGRQPRLEPLADERAERDRPAAERVAVGEDRGGDPIGGSARCSSGCSAPPRSASGAVR
jgi:hypothetical protein